MLKQWRTLAFLYDSYKISLCKVPGLNRDDLRTGSIYFFFHSFILKSHVNAYIVLNLSWTAGRWMAD